MLEKKEQKPLWTLWECSFDISPKIALNVSENPLLKHRGLLNRWKRRLKIYLLKTYTPLQDLAPIFQLAKNRCNWFAIFSLNYYIVTSLQVYWGLARDLQQSAFPNKINAAPAKQVISNS